MAGLFDDLIPAKPAAESGGLFDDLIPAPKREVGAFESFDRGVRGIPASLGQQGAFLLGLPGAAALDALSSVFSGKLDTSHVDAAGDYIGDRQSTLTDLAVDPNTEQQGVGGKVAQGAPGVLVDLAAAIATGGESLLAKGATRLATEEGLSAAMRQAARTAAETGAKASVVPASRAAIDRAETVVERGGTAAEAAAAGGTQYGASTAANMVPVAATGGLLSRALQGAVASAPLEYAERGIVEVATPARLGIDKPMTVEDALLSTLFGTGLSGALGQRVDDAPMDLRGDTQAVKDRALEPGRDKAAALADFLQLMHSGEKPTGFVPDAPVAPVPRPIPTVRDVSTPIAPLLAPVPRQIANVSAEPPLLDRPAPPAATVERAAPATAPEPAGAVPEAIDLTPGPQSRSVRIGNSSITYAAGPDGVKLNFIGTPKKAGREAGSAEAALKTFLGQTDAAGQPVTLVVEPQGAGIDPARLERLYARNGFVPTGKTADGATVMRREPAVPVEAPKPVAAPVRPAPKPAPAPRPRDATMFRQGKNAQAVKMNDGTWYTRTRKSGQWQPWEKREKFDASPVFGYRPTSPPTGVVTIPGVGRVVVGDRAVDAPRGGVPRPKTLLDHVSSVGLNREAFRLAGVNPDYFGTRAGIRYVFRKDGGMTPDGLLEMMQQDGYLNPEDPNAPPQFDNNDAINLLQDALDGQDVFSHDQSDAVAAWREQQRADLEGDVPDLDPADVPEALRLMDAAEEAADNGEPPAEFFARYEGEPNPEAIDHGPDSRPSEADRGAGVPPRAEEQATPASRGQTGLFPPATAREAVDAAARARDDERNGRTGTGRTDMLSGRGELFAGPRPDQARVDEPPATPPEPAPEPKTTSLKNEVMQAEREARGEEPLPATERQSNDDTLERAKTTLEANPARGAEIVEAINNDVHGTATNDDQAVLLVHKQNVMKARDRAAERAADPALSADQRAVARREFDQLEGDLHRIDEATKAIGTESGRILQLRTRLLRDDMTFEALERKQRAILGRPLTAEESATIKQQAERIAKLEAENEATRKALEDASVDADAQTTYRNLVEEMARALKPDGSAKKRPILETLKKRADDSRAALAALDDVKSNRKQSGAVINPVAFLHLANIGAYHIANGAAKLADFVARMKADLGERFGRFSDAMPDVYEAAKAQIAATTKAGKTVATPAQVAAGIDAANLTHRDVYELARAHILAGTHGEKAVMAATHGDLVKLFPDLTERDVRRLFSDYGKAKFPSKAADKAELRELRALVQMQESIDRLTEGLAALKSGQQRDRATQLVRDKRKQLNAMLREQERKYGASPERLASYQDARITNLKNQIEDLERELRTGEKPPKPGKAPEPNAEAKRLQAIRDDLKKQLAAIEARRNPPKSPEELYQERRAKTIAKQLADVRARLARNDYSKATRKPPKELNAANKKAAFELAKAKQDIALKQFELAMKSRPLWRRALGTAAETLNLSRAVMTSFDLSAVLRQGGFIVLGHPLRGARSIAPMLKALASEKAAFDVDEEIANRPNFDLYKKAGLYLSEQNNHLPSKMEEAYLSRWLQKTEPTGGKVKRAAITAKNVATAPIRASGRAFTTFLNKLRADTFDEMAGALSANGQLTIEEARALGNFINVATGRGKIGSKQQAAVGLNTIFFAPKLVASRFNLLGGQPLYGGSNRTRALIAQDYARFLAGVATTIGLAALAHDPEDGPLTSLDPRSSDFLKIRFGNTFIDPLAGLAQVTTFLAREGTGEKVTTTGKLVPIRDSYRLTDYVDWAGDPNKGKVAFGGDDGLDIALRFARTKFAPVPGGIASLLSGKDVTGQPVDAADVTVGLVTPLSFRNVIDLMREHGVDGGAAILTLEMLGMGVQYRKPREAAEDDDKPRTRKSKYE
jgi:hypothetical protein